MAQDKCKRCGKCCIVKLDIMGFLVPSHQVCPYLKYNEEEKNYFCDVYKNRFQVAGWCHPITDAIAEGSVPDTCGYIEGTNYKSKLKENINIKEDDNV
jgi:uncharacterized cysteine cluster protein YcgN (CxxCxxCC family)